MDLTHLFNIVRKPEPLGTELNTMDCYFTGELLLIEIHRRKEDKNKRKGHMQLGSAAAFTKSMVVATNSLYLRGIKGATNL